MDAYDVQGKTVLCRVDINQPVDRVSGKLKSVNRIRACVPTVRELADRGAKVVLLAHQGSDIEYKNFYTTAPHAEVLSELLEREVKFIDDVTGPAAREAIRLLKNGEVLLLDNVRFCSEEQTLFETKLCLTHEQQAKTQVVENLAPLAVLYVCDAFAAAHRDHPRFAIRAGSAQHDGRLFEQGVLRDLRQLWKRRAPVRIRAWWRKSGGRVFDDGNRALRGTADKVLTGGLVANILLSQKASRLARAALRSSRKSGYDTFIEKSVPLLERYGDRIVLPLDAAYLDAQGKRAEADVGSIPADAGVLDIGAKSAALYETVIKNAKTAFVNGPMGVFEQPETELGTKAVWRALGATEAYTVVGGGDSITATEKYGLVEKMGYICTGGGALIRFLTGEELPVVKALRYAAKKFPEGK